MEQNSGKSYRRFGVMMIFSFFLMYGAMYAMADKFENIYPNLNQFYMTGLMVCLMGLAEIFLMAPMYRNKRANLFIVFGGFALAIFFFSSVRVQLAVRDVEFLKSMVPHHAAAILMCERAKIESPEIKALCTDIVSNQQREIDEMKSILKRLGSSEWK
jgi:peptidoglycan/LPS O-acetylase OafA/YrhL